MKNMKMYIKPAMKVYEVKTSQILAGSLQVDETELGSGYGTSQ